MDRIASWMGQAFKVPRETSTLSLIQAVIPTADRPVLDALFTNAIREAFRVLFGGFRHLELPPRTDIPNTWTEQGSPTILLSMHHGNWEWLAGILYHLRPDTIGVARDARHPLGQRLLRYARSHHRTPVHYDQAAVRTSFRTLRKGGLVAFLPDQRPPTAGVPGVWLGESTLVSPLPKLWANCKPAALWIGSLTPLDPRTYRLILECHPASALEQWDKHLDHHFLPLVHHSPSYHFGFFHHRLVSRGTIASPSSSTAKP